MQPFWFPADWLAWGLNPSCKAQIQPYKCTFAFKGTLTRPRSVPVTPVGQVRRDGSQLQWSDAQRKRESGAGKEISKGDGGGHERSRDRGAGRGKAPGSEPSPQQLGDFSAAGISKVEFEPRPWRWRTQCFEHRRQEGRVGGRRQLRQCLYEVYRQDTRGNSFFLLQTLQNSQEYFSRFTGRWLFCILWFRSLVKPPKTEHTHRVDDIHLQHHGTSVHLSKIRCQDRSHFLHSNQEDLQYKRMRVSEVVRFLLLRIIDFTESISA